MLASSTTPLQFIGFQHILDLQAKQRVQFQVKAYKGHRYSRLIEGTSSINKEQPNTFMLYYIIDATSL